MVYLEYERAKADYRSTFAMVQDAVNEHEELFLRTQPHSVDYGKEKVDGGGGSDPFDVYLDAKERAHIDKRIAEGMALLKERQELLSVKEQEVRNSKAMIDKIYTLKYLNGMKLYRVAKTLGYSERQMYRYVIEIEAMRRKMSENVRQCQK